MIVMLLTGICIGKIQAQNDPVLAGMILLYTDKAQKELKNQEKVMMLQTTGHIWTKEEVQATADLQRESGPSSAMPHRFMAFITKSQG